MATSPNQTSSIVTAPPVIGTRKYCNNCKTERIELIDKNGITDHGFKTWRWAQTCDNCKLNDCLEYLPIRLGDSIIDTVNQALSETKKEQEQEQEQPSEPPIQIQKMESMEEWRKAVKTKYDNLEKVVKDNLPSLWLAIEFVLSIRSIMNIAGVTLPWFGIILGRASSLKTGSNRDA